VDVTVIIVDDDAGFRRVARELLEGSGITVVAEAADGRQAREVCRRHAPHGVLLDVNLPDTSGHALARELHREQPGLRILLTSTDASAGGVDGVTFLPKIELALNDLAAYFSA
jgi:DNA-binding NarL/FixJ family response regulator